MGQNVMKDELGADQRQTCLMSVRIYLSSFWEVVSKCDSGHYESIASDSLSCPALGELLA